MERNIHGMEITDEMVSRQANWIWRNCTGLLPMEQEVIWELARRCLGLKPWPMHREIAKEAYKRWRTRESFKVPGNAETDWFAALQDVQASLDYCWRVRGKAVEPLV